MMGSHSNKAATMNAIRAALHLAAFSVVIGMLLPVAALAQGWKPERNVELIVPSTAGGSLDLTGSTVHRIWDDLKLLPVSSTVANRSGGGHAVAYNFLSQRA